MILGGGVLLILHERIGWQLTFVGMALILALATLPVWVHRERPRTTRVAVSRARILAFLARPDTPRILVLIVAFKSGDAFAAGVLRPFLVDAGLELGDIGWLLGTYGFVAGLVGALVGGVLVNVFGRKLALVIFGVFQAVAVAGYGLLSVVEPTYGLVAAVATIEHFAGGTATAALFTCMMDWCSRDSSATDYTVQASVVVIATGLAATLSGFSAAALGYTGHFVLGTALTLGAVLVVLRLFPKGQTDA
jgi:predicted MFS family arabinose efflux permease